MINVQIERNNNENSLATLRRFNKQVQGAGIIRRVRSIRYMARAQSPLNRKKHALTGIRRREEVKKLIKLGKLPDKMTRS